MIRHLLNMYCAIIMMISFSSSFVFADTLGDCDRAMAVTDAQRQSLVTNTDYDELYSSDNLWLAVRHLRSYCRDISKKQSDTTTLQVAQSPRLYDHLIDIGWRSLDADDSYGIQSHPLGIAWREGIMDMISKPEGVLPKVLADRYTAQRTSMTTLVSSCDDIPSDTSSRRLGERYIHMCVVSSCIEKKLMGNAYNKPFPDQSKIDVCQQRAMQRIEQEGEFVRYRMKQASTNVAKNIWQKYLNEDLLQRSSFVLEMMHYYEQDLTNVTRKVQGTKQCT